jgi:hypothetical protein
LRFHAPLQQKSVLRQKLIWNDLKASSGFAAQVSAVAVTAETSAVKYAEGVMVFDAKGGLMYEGISRWATI